MPSLSPGAQMRAMFLWPALDLAKTALGGHRPDGREGLKVKYLNFCRHSDVEIERAAVVSIVDDDTYIVCNSQGVGDSDVTILPAEHSVRPFAVGAAPRRGAVLNHLVERLVVGIGLDVRVCGNTFGYLSAESLACVEV